MGHQIEFEVVGHRRINCSRCEARIGDALRRLPGVQDVAASAESQRVSLNIDPSEISADRVRLTLSQLDYEVV